MVRHLCEKGALMEKPIKCITDRFIMLQRRRLDVVNALLEAGADMNVITKKGCSPCYLAAKNGHIDVVKALIGANADLNSSNIKGQSPLHIAAYMGHQR